MKTIILLIALVLCNLSFGCVILPNGNYIPCETNTTKILIEKSIKEHLKQIGYYKALIENKKIIDIEIFCQAGYNRPHMIHCDHK